MKLTGRDILEILKTVDALGYRRFRLEHDGLKLEVDADTTNPVTDRAVVPDGRGEPAPSDGPDPDNDAAPEPIVATPLREGLIAVTAPMTGGFFRSPEPGAAPFVEVGSQVQPTDTVCLIEVMKLFSSIKAGQAGTVVEICAENETQVRANQPVMWIDPA